MKRVIFFSGAGISAPSGIPTYKKEKGISLWNGEKIENICSIRTFPRNYDRVHDFYDNFRKLIGTKESNIAHKTISELQHKYGKDRIINITQNIDDFFERENVDTMHVHGSIKEIKCLNCGCVENIDYSAVDRENCKNCNVRYKLKPNIVFYGEESKISYEAKHTMLSIENGDIVVIIGTDGAVYPIDSVLRKMIGLFKLKPLLILNNLEKSKYISEYYFNHIFYESCETGILKIKEIIENELK